MFKRKGLLRYLRYALVQDRNPDSLAKGLAIGLFVAFLPLPAFQGVIAFFVAHFLGVNRALAVGATLVTNWLTMAPVFLGAVWVGSVILPGISVETLTPVAFRWDSLREISDDVLLAYITGTLFFSFATGIMGYALLKVYAERREKLRWQRIEEP